MSFLNCPFFLILLAVLGTSLYAYRWHRDGANASTWTKVLAIVWGLLLGFDVLHHLLHVI